MNFAVLLAAGGSSRFRESCPQEWPVKDKLNLRIGGEPLWFASFRKLRAHVDGVGIVCPPGQESEFRADGAAFVVAGGETRLDSSRIGVGSVPPKAELVLVHDAARPYVSDALIGRVLSAASEHGAAIPALPVTDTIKRGDAWVRETVDRLGLYRVQTPQAARREWLERALEQAETATDESMALEQAGYNVRFVEGEEKNIKITTAADLDRVSVTGYGYDIHAFSNDPARPLMLGGVRFEGAGLEGHSDADAVLHAVTDALLGSCGLGDIGEHFPNTDPRWRDADSRIFLREAVRMVREEQAEVLNVDVTIIAERPRISDRRAEIREALSEELGVEARRINVKATTAEGLGAIGRGEGIAAMAVATVNRVAGF